MTHSLKQKISRSIPIPVMRKILIALKVIIIIKNFPKYFLHFMGVVKTPIIQYNLRNGIKFLIRTKTNDRLVFNEVLFYNLYLKKFNIKEDDIIIDIGGHIGFFAITASKMAKKGKVYCFEPLEENFNLLRKNREINNAQNLFIFQKAISNKKRKDFFYFNKLNYAGGSLIKINNGEKRAIYSDTLKNIIKKNNLKKIDFLKMDCEGKEFEILFKSPKEVLAKIQKISFEYHNFDHKNNMGTLATFLKKQGFKVFIGEKNFRNLGMIYAIRK